MKLKVSRRQCGFTLVETVCAAGCLALLFGGLFALSGRSLQLVRYSGQQAAASVCLTQRLEEMRRLKWASIVDTTTPNYLRDYVLAMLSNAPNSADAVPGFSEQITINSYPTAGTPLTVNRSAGGSASASSWDPNLANASTLRVDAQINWPSPNGGTSSRKFSTIMTKGGITR